MEAHQAGSSGVSKEGDASGSGQKRGRGRPKKETVEKRVVGRPVLPRTIRGPSADNKTIIVKIGGRWDKVPDLGLFYNGGYTRYIHNCFPPTFTLLDLLRAMMKIVADVDHVCPQRFWFHMHGVEYPGGLMVIKDDKDITAMWKNVEEHSAPVACVFVQDVEADKSTSYAIPLDVPPLIGYFKPGNVYDLATKKQWYKDRVGPVAQWENEAYGRYWYTSAEAIPRVYGV